MPGWLSPRLAEFWQVAAWMVAIIGGLVAAFKAVAEMRLSRLQKDRDLAWNQAKEATLMIDRLSLDPQAKAAILMLDWTIREYTLPSGRTAVISREEVADALRIEDLIFTHKEGYVRECFDALFNQIDRIENAIEVGLVRESDMLSFLEYYFEVMAKHHDIFSDFMNYYEYRGTINFALRVSTWTGKIKKGTIVKETKQTNTTKKTTKPVKPAAG
jgi:hypothetical protein